MDAFWNLSFSNLAYKLCKDNNIRGFQIILELQPELAKEKFTNEQTLLIYAADRGYVKIVTYLLAIHSDVKAVDKSGNTALMRACFHGYYEIILLLLQCSSLINHRNNDGQTAKELICCGATKENALASNRQRIQRIFEVQRTNPRTVRPLVEPITIPDTLSQWITLNNLPTALLHIFPTFGISSIQNIATAATPIIMSIFRDSHLTEDEQNIMKLHLLYLKKRMNIEVPSSISPAVEVPRPNNPPQHYLTPSQQNGIRSKQVVFREFYEQILIPLQLTGSDVQSLKTDLLQNCENIFPATEIMMISENFEEFLQSYQADLQLFSNGYENRDEEGDISAAVELSLRSVSIDSSQHSRTPIRQDNVVNTPPLPNQLPTIPPIIGFLSHDHGEGSANHRKIGQVYQKLMSKGINCWLDENFLMAGHDIYREITSGLEQCKIFLLFLTNGYNQRLQTPGSYCNFEYNLAVEFLREGRLKIIPVIMETEMKDSRNWWPQMRGVLGSSFFIDFTDCNWTSEPSVEGKCEMLAQNIRNILASRTDAVLPFQGNPTRPPVPPVPPAAPAAAPPVAPPVAPQISFLEKQMQNLDTIETNPDFFIELNFIERRMKLDCLFMKKLLVLKPNTKISEIHLGLLAYLQDGIDTEKNDLISQFPLKRQEILDYHSDEHFHQFENYSNFFHLACRKSDQVRKRIVGTMRSAREEDLAKIYRVQELCKVFMMNGENIRCSLHDFVYEHNLL